MTSATGEAKKSLHGDWVFSPKISGLNAGRLLAKRWYAMEFGHKERVKTLRSEDYPGVAIVQLFMANTVSTEEPPSLEDAEAEGKHSMKFLISQAGDLAIVSSIIGYNISGPVRVPQPSRFWRGEIPVQGFNIIDYAMNMAENLERTHIARLSQYGANPATELPQETADSIFRYMLSGTEEIR